MPCDAFALEIGAYVDGELAASQRDLIEDHLRECSPCRRTALEFSALDRLGAGGEPPPVSGDEWSRCLQAVKERSRAETQILELSPRRSLPRWLAPAAAIAAAVLLAFVLVDTLRQAPATGGAPIAGQAKPTEAEGGGTEADAESARPRTAERKDGSATEVRGLPQELGEPDGDVDRAGRRDF